MRGERRVIALNHPIDYSINAFLFKSEAIGIKAHFPQLSPCFIYRYFTESVKLLYTRVHLSMSNI